MQTPCYSFDIEQIQKNWIELKQEIVPDQLFYALKANADIKILTKLNSMNASFEVASVGEMNKLLSIGVTADKIISSLPIKPLDMLNTFVRNDIKYFVFDMLPEFNKLKREAPFAKKILRLDITEFSPHTIAFGAQLEQVIYWLNEEIIQPDEIDGVTFYLAKNKQIEVLEKILFSIEDLLLRLPRGRIINMGGNFRLPSELDEGFYPRLRKTMFQLRKRYNAVFFAEPGRSVVKNAGRLFSTVIAVKEKKDSTWVYIDAGVPTGISYAPDSVMVDNGEKIDSLHLYRFFDITCSHRLLFEMKLPFLLTTSAIVIFENFGSYSLAKASTFHGWELPEVIYK